MIVQLAITFIGILVLLLLKNAIEINS